MKINLPDNAATATTCPDLRATIFGKNSLVVWDFNNGQRTNKQQLNATKN